jgi:RNA-directed DNA polymerase
VDRQSVEAFSQRADTYLKELSESLAQGHYRPAAVKRVDIPKGKGQTRPLGIPTVKDRIVQTAMLMVIEPIFEAMFLDVSYGFRPGRGALDALAEVERLLEQGYTYVVDADLQAFFDSIPHAGLMARVKESISDGRLLELLQMWLNQDIMAEGKCWKPTGGTPQGAVISPLLANIYLHYLDKEMAGKGFKMVRYADDFVVMCKSEAEAKAAMFKVMAWVKDNNLCLSPEKTQVGNCLEPGQGFEFLGYHFERGHKFVRRKSLVRMRDRLRELTPRNSGQSLEMVIERLNRTLRGWYGYFKYAVTDTFKKLDMLVRRRLRAMLLKQNKRSGFGRSLGIHKRWPNSFFAEKGLFTMYQARIAAFQSR